VTYCYQQSLSRYVTCQDVYVEQSHAGLPSSDFK